MKRHLAHALAACLLALPIACTQAEPTSAPAKESKDRANAVDELDSDTRVLAEMTRGTDIPMSQRNRAQCVVVVPAMVQGALLVGGSGGNGVVTCRTGNGWSGPAFIKMGGPSIGLQAGVQSSDLLMLVDTSGAVGKLFRTNFQLGVNASVAAGPVGEGKKASTNAQMNAEILTYAKSRGAFAGVDVSGMFIKQSQPMNVALYGPSADSSAILQGLLPAPKEASQFLHQMRTAFPPRSESSPAVSLE